MRLLCFVLVREPTLPPMVFRSENMHDNEKDSDW